MERQKPRLFVFPRGLLVAASFFQRLFRRGTQEQSVCLEFGSEGFAWCTEAESGYLPCKKVDRLGKLSELVSGKNLEGARATVVLPLDQYSVFQLERPPRLTSFNSDTDTVFNFIDELVAASQIVAIDRRANQFIL